MPKRIPITAAKDVAEKYGCKQIILLAWDGEITHLVTYGKTLNDCDQAAAGGNRIQELLDWPESLRTEPSRVRKLKDKIAELERELKGFRLLAEQNA